MPDAAGIAHRECSRRVDYIDLLRGFIILWVVWHHVCWESSGLAYRMPAFAFLAGIFFKVDSPRAFLSKLWRQILLPFCFFYVASCVLRILLHACQTGSFGGFDYGIVLSLFGVSAEHYALDPVNGPLWFLLCVCWMRLAAWLLLRMPRPVVAAVVAVIIWYKYAWSFMATLFALNNAVELLPFFVAGNVWGKRLIAFLARRQRRYAAIVVSAVTLIAAWMLLDRNSVMWAEKWYAYAVVARSLSFVILLMCVFSFLDGRRAFGFLRFFGRNSLIVLSVHSLMLESFGEPLFRELAGPLPELSAGVIVFAVVLLSLVPVIWALNRLVPGLVGKQNRVIKKYG